MVKRSPLRTRIRGPDGHPVADAGLWIECASEPMPDIATLSDEHGEALMSVPASGRFAIVCAANGFSTTRTMIDATAETPTDVIIELEQRA